MAHEPDTTAPPATTAREAGRGPTPAEAAAAERSAETVDVDRVAESYEEMAELGANVEGEGQIDRD